MGKKSTPKAPDYTAAAQAQADSSRDVTEQQTWANRPTQNTPWGQTTWENTPEWDPTTQQYINKWTQNINLTPEQQQALDSQMRIQQGYSDTAESMLGRVRNEFGSAMDWGGLSPMAATPDPTALDPSGISAPQYNFEGLAERQQVSPGGPTTVGQASGGGAGFSLDTSNMPELIGINNGTRQRAEDAIYNRRTSRLDPMWGDREKALQTELYNKGLREGDEAYTKAMRDFNFGRTDAYETAMNEAIMGGGTEMQRDADLARANRGQIFTERALPAQLSASTSIANANAATQASIANQNAGLQAQSLDWQKQLGAAQFAEQQRSNDLAERFMMGDKDFANQQTLFNLNQNAANTAYNQNMQSAEYANRLRQQQIAEAQQQRGFSLNEMNAILNGQQVGMPGMPQFNQAQRSESTQYNQAAQNQYQASLDAYNARQAATQGMMSGAANIAGTAMMFSDRRLKRNIRKIGTLARHGVNLYAYDYVWGEPGVGVMADEVAHIPGAVLTHPSGFAVVNYEVIYG